MGVAVGLHIGWNGRHQPGVLTSTTNTNHVKNLIDYLANQPGLTDRFLFQAYPDFDTNWSVPRQILASLLTETWDTTAEMIELAET